MTEVSAKDFASLHAACFTLPRPWSEAEFTALLAQPGVFAIGTAKGALLGRVVADEAELLTLAVDPAERRKGLGQSLVLAFHKKAIDHSALTAFLEVAARNRAARALYEQSGWQEAGLRRAYYRGAAGEVDDAVIMTRRLR